MRPRRVCVACGAHASTEWRLAQPDAYLCHACDVRAEASARARARARADADADAALRAPASSPAPPARSLFAASAGNPASPSPSSSNSRSSGGSRGKSDNESDSGSDSGSAETSSGSESSGESSTKSSVSYREETLRPGRGRGRGRGRGGARGRGRGRGRGRAADCDLERSAAPVPKRRRVALPENVKTLAWSLFLARDDKLLAERVWPATCPTAAAVVGRPGASVKEALSALAVRAPRKAGRPPKNVCALREENQRLLANIRCELRQLEDDGNGDRPAEDVATTHERQQASEGLPSVKPELSPRDACNNKNGGTVNAQPRQPGASVPVARAVLENAGFTGNDSSERSSISPPVRPRRGRSVSSASGASDESTPSPPPCETSGAIPSTNRVDLPIPSGPSIQPTDAAHPSSALVGIHPNGDVGSDTSPSSKPRESPVGDRKTPSRLSDMETGAVRSEPDPDPATPSTAPIGSVVHADHPRGPSSDEGEVEMLRSVPRDGENAHTQGCTTKVVVDACGDIAPRVSGNRTAVQTCPQPRSNSHKDSEKSGDAERTLYTRSQRSFAQSTTQAPLCAEKEAPNPPVAHALEQGSSSGQSVPDTSARKQIEKQNNRIAALERELASVHEKLEAETAKSAELEEMLGLQGADPREPAASEIERLQTLVADRDRELSSREDLLREKEELLAERSQRVTCLMLELAEVQSALSVAEETAAATLDASTRLNLDASPAVEKEASRGRMDGHSCGPPGFDRREIDLTHHSGDIHTEDEMKIRISELERLLEDANLELVTEREQAQRQREWFKNALKTNRDLQKKYFHLKVEVQSLRSASEKGKPSKLVLAPANKLA